MNSFCSILSKSKTKIYTCLDKKDISDIIISYLNFCGKQCNEYEFIINKSKFEMYSFIKKILKLEERDWWLYNFIPIELKLKLKYAIYKPIKPKGKWSWLNVDHINSIMLQNTKDSFYYYGTVMSDHFKIFPEHLHLLYDILYKQNKDIGIIFNTSTSKQKGKHWIAVYITKNIFKYFDPVGDKPNIHLKKFISDFMKFYFGKLEINTKEFQKKDGTCGLYSIDFLLNNSQKNKKVSMSQLQLDNDIKINKKRTIYFV